MNRIYICVCIYIYITEESNRGGVEEADSTRTNGDRQRNGVVRDLEFV